LNDEPKVQHKKRGLFSRFGDNANAHTEATNANAEPKPRTAGDRFLSGITGGRKRGQSATGSELAPMANARPEIRNAQAVEAN
jgi:hypothetical protein